MKRHLLILLLFSFVLIAPALVSGARGSDLLCHSLWIKLFASQLWHGNLYPRWLMDMYLGRGSSVFFYYPPLVYYITSLFVFLSPLDTFGYYAIAASALVGTYVSALTFYCWIKEETGKPDAALIGALLYAATPAHLAWSFYFCLLFTTFWAYAWMPLMLLFARRIARGEPYGVAGFAASLALLILTSLPMTLIFGPVAVVYGVLHFHKKGLLRQAAKLAAAVLLGFAVTAIYLAPALLYMNFTLVDSRWDMSQGGYNIYFVILGFGTLTQDTYTLAWLGMAALTFLYGKACAGRSRLFFFLLAISAIGLFMALSASKPVWDSIPVLMTLQFPHRFFALPALALAALASLAFPHLRRFNYGVLAVYFAVVLATAFWPRTIDDKTYEEWTYDIDQYAHYLSSYDLIPRYYTPEGLAEVKTHTDKVENISGDAVTQVTRWEPRDITLHYRAGKPSVLRIRQFYFPGWEARIGDAKLDLKPEDSTGEILLFVPQGEGDIRLELKALLPEMAGKEVSILSLAVIAILWLAGMRRRSQPA